VQADDIELLSSAGLFGAFSREEMESIAPAIPVKDFERGRHVYTPAYRGRLFFVLLKGRVRVYRAERGREITVAVIWAGETFGEGAFTARRFKGSYAEAVVPSRVALMSRDHVERLVHRNPRVGVKLIEILSERLAFSEHMVAEIGLKEVHSRLAGLILDLADSEGVATSEGRKIPTRYTQEQLGTMIGAKRVAVTRAFTGLRKDGAVRVRGQRIYVTDMEALKRAAS
jgi:CRP/FNR family transcriptional regulator, cyclic AMP receptor protein